MVLDHRDNNLKDELLPELEVSLTPSKLSDMYKVDLFGLSEDFLNYLALQNLLPGKYDDDVHIMALEKIPQFIRTIRDMYRKYRAMYQ